MSVNPAAASPLERAVGAMRKHGLSQPHAAELAVELNPHLREAWPADLVTNVVAIQYDAPAASPGDEEPAGDTGLSLPLAAFLAETSNPVPSLLGDGLIPRGGTVLVSGEGGIGKSSFASQLAVSLGQPAPDFLGLWIPRLVPVLFVEREGNRDSWRARLAVLCANLSIEQAAVFVAPPPQSRELSLESPALRREIEHTGAELVVADTVSRLALFDENSSRDWKEKVLIPATEIAAATGCAFLFLHHWSKPADNRDGRHRTRGTSAMVDDVDTAIRLSPGPSPDLRVLEFDKVRCGPEPAAMTVRFQKERALFVAVSAEEMEAAAGDAQFSADEKKLSDACGAILAFLEKHPDEDFSGRQIQHECHVGNRILWRALDRLAENGPIEGSPGPRNAVHWRLKAAE